ncbi:MAG: hypothetical protein PHC84_04390 [Clostridia bacterium]|nr:hypothetical protein [Clostridia bacterium]
MFAKLYSETTITKLKKIPLIFWYLFYGIAVMFASVYTLKEIGQDYIALLNEFITGFNTGRLLILFYPTLFVTEIIVFEIIAYFANTLLVRRFPEVAHSDFVFKLRLTEIIVFFAVGALSLLFFAFPVISSTGSVVLNSLFQAFFLGIFLYELTKNYARTPHAAYKYIASLYVGINLVLNVLMLTMLFTYQDTTVMEYVDAGIKVGLYLFIAFMAYLQYGKLKKLPPKDGGTMVLKDETVFKDFGF